MKMETLGAVAEYINGRAFKPNEWESTGLPIIRIQNLNDPLAKYNYSSQIFEEKYRVHKGDLLYAWSASLGAHIWKGTDAWLNQHIFHVIPHDNIDQHYLYYFLCKITMELYSKAHGTGMVHITKAPFMATEIPVPSLPEQERIVARIEELFSELDKAVETLQTTKQQLEVYRQAVLKEAFSNIAAQRTIKEISEIVTSGSRGWAQFYSDSGAMFIRIGNLRRMGIRIHFEDIQYVNLPNGAEGIRTRLKPNDVLVSITADLGSIGLVPASISEAYINQHIALIRFRDSNKAPFYAWYLRSERGQKDLLKNKRGGGKLGLGLDDIRNTHVPEVSDEEAIEVVNQIDSRMSVCDSIEQTVDMALSQADALRQSILKEAFEGRLT